MLRSAPKERVSKHGHEHHARSPPFETVAEFTPRCSRGGLLHPTRAIVLGAIARRPDRSEAEWRDLFSSS